MSILTNMRIPAKIGLAFAVVCSIILVGGIVNVFSFMRLHATDQRVAAIAQGGEAIGTFLDVSQVQQRSILEFMLTGDQTNLDHFQSAEPEYRRAREALNTDLPEDFPQAPLEKMVSAVEKLRTDIYARQIKLMRRPETVAEARALEISTLPRQLHQQRSEGAQALEAWLGEALAAARTEQRNANATMETMTYASVILTLVAAVAMGLGLTRGLATPITRINRFMNKLSDGDLSDDHIPGQGRRDEIGNMAEAVAVFRDGLIRANDLAAEQQAHQAEKEEEQRRIRRLVQSFEGTVIAVLDGLSNADHLLRDTAERMTTGAGTTLEKSNLAADAASNASSDVNTVASSAEELSASIQEISRRVAEATSVASQAVTEARVSSEEIEQLDASVARIGEVVDMINDIASQTNLLALNATIEAARAGDAGKGFAVVANEVKTLANQTGKATEEVASQITAIQSATSRAVSSIRKVTAIIHDIDEISSSIAAAVEEQGAATSEIARGAEHTAAATGEVVSVMTDLREAAEGSGRIANELAEASDKISTQSETLKHEVRDFLGSVQHSDEHDGEPALVSFGDHHSFGVPKIDDEHRKLMELTNQLYRHIKSGSEQTVMDSCFRDLKTYSVDHFAGEDTYMEKTGYADRAAHQRHHAQFIQRLDSLYEAYRRGETTASMDLLALLGSWWRTHMEEDDAALARFIRDRQAA